MFIVVICFKCNLYVMLFKRLFKRVVVRQGNRVFTQSIEIWCVAVSIVQCINLLFNTLFN